MNITLIGYRGSGKTTIGHLLAKRLDWRCVDTDYLITHHAGITIKEIFEREGEPGFREREAVAVREAATLTNTVIAAGGGSILRADNRDTFRKAGKVIWLQAPAAILFARTEADAATNINRPRLTTSGGIAEVEQLLEKRRPHYEAAAHITLDVSALSPDEAARQIYKWWVGIRHSAAASGSVPEALNPDGSEKPPLPAIQASAPPPSPT